MLTAKKRITIYIIIAVVAIAAIIGAIAINNQTDTPAELLSLGEQYLLDLDYENALVQFLKVIEIEPMNERAYIGAAEAYIGLGQTEEAIAILERGLAALPNSAAIAAMLDELRPPVEEETTPPDSHGFTEEQTGLLGQLKAALEGEDYLAAAEIVSGSEYDQIVQAVNAQGTYFLQDADANFAVFEDGHAYLGDIADGSREGNGTWFDGGSTTEEYQYFVGAFADDAPNGNGVIYSVTNEGAVEREGDNAYALETEERGAFADGVFNGEVATRWTMDDGTELEWLPSYVDGAPQIMDGAEVEDDGLFVIAVSPTDGMELISYGDERSIFGF